MDKNPIALLSEPRSWRSSWEGRMFTFTIRRLDSRVTRGVPRNLPYCLFCSLCPFSLVRSPVFVSAFSVQGTLPVQKVLPAEHLSFSPKTSVRIFVVKYSFTVMGRKEEYWWNFWALRHCRKGGKCFGSGLGILGSTEIWGKTKHC